MPRVSVIVPTYNRRVLVQEAIDSILAQTYADYEVIVVDDGSPDGTGDVLRTRYGNRIRYMWQQNRGESVALNRGIEMARGRYVATLNDDDIWLPDKLARQVPILDSEPRVGMVFCQNWFVDVHGRLLDSTPYPRDLVPGDISLEALCLENVTGAAGSTALIRTDALHEIGGFDPEIRFGEDWDLWLRIVRNWGITLVPEPLAYIRRHLGTQCYFPSPEKNSLILADHLRILEKALANWPGEIPAGLPNRARARRYLQAALREYACGRPNNGLVYLETAAELDPGTYCGTRSLSQTVVDGALAAAELADGSVDIERADGFLGLVLGGPRFAALGRAFRRRSYARLYVALGFINRRVGDIPRAAFCFRTAVRFAPAYVLNGGVISLLLESAVGPSPARALRQIVRSVGRKGHSQHRTGD